MSIIFQVLIYLSLGASAGFLSGLLGIGGGMVVVPVLIAFFDYLDLNANLMQYATGTSLAVMVFTTLSSSLAHFKRKAINWGLVKYLGTGTAIGAIIGRNISSYIPTSYLAVIFIGVVIYTAFRMFLQRKPANIDNINGEHNTTVLSLWGLGVGLFSSLLGLGGVLTVPVIVRLHYPTQIAVAVAAVCGLFISTTSTINSILTGFHIENIPYSWGSIYVPAFLCIACASMIFAPLGVRVAHKLKSDSLRKLFAVFLCFVIIEMTINAIRNF